MGSTERHGIFLSYARQDGEVFAARLRELLQERAPDIRILQDRLLLEGGRGWRQQLRDAIESVSFLVLVMTPAAATSEEVRAEWDFARACGVCVYPVKGAPDADLRFHQMPQWMSKVHFFDIDREWESFVAHLRAPCQAPRAVFMARDAPAAFVMRPVEFSRAKTLLLARQPAEATVVLSGPGGFGKTTLAQAICADTEIRRHFDDGILWIDSGPHPDPLTALATLYAALTGERPAFTSEEDAIVHVAQKLDGRSCLVVIDDVWDLAHLKPLVRATKGCMRLVTSQISQVADWDLGEVRRVAVDVMTPRESIELLGPTLADVDPRELKKLARDLGGWPVALEIAGATMRRRVAQGEAPPAALAHTLRILSTRGVNALRKQTAENRHRTIGATLNLALELLPKQSQLRLKELSIFPEGLEIPLSAAGILWGLKDRVDIEEVADELAGFSLMRLDLGRRSIRLHDVIRRWLGEQVANPARLHERLLRAWRDRLDLPDAYAWRWLPWHLAQAGRKVALYQLARDEQFLALQQERLREQPYAPLTTIQTALEYAVSKRDMAALAEMVLRHADHFEKLSQQSPMDAFRAGESARAFELAGGFEIERRILWFLLLAWEAKESERAADLRTALERVGESRPFPQWKARQSRLAADLMLEALEPGAELFLELRKQSLNWCGLFDLSLALARSDALLVLAPSVAMEIGPPLERARALVRIGSQQALRGQSDLAHDTFVRAMETARASRFEEHEDGFDDDYGPTSWGWLGEENVLEEIAVAQASAGDLASASETIAGLKPTGAKALANSMAAAEPIEPASDRVDALLTIARAQVTAGLLEEARANLRSVVPIALNDWSDVNLSETLQRIARTQVEAGDSEFARTTYAQAILESRGYRVDFQSSGREFGEALAGVARGFAQKGRFGAALRVLKGVDSWVRDLALVDVAKVQARRDNWKGALKTAAQIEDAYQRSKALVGVGTVVFGKSNAAVSAAILEAAYKASLKIPKFSIRALALWQVGTAFLQCNPKKAGLLVLAEAARFASSIEPGEGSDDPDDGQEILRDIAVTQAQAGDRDAAMATLKLIYHQDLHEEASREVENPVKPAVEVNPRVAAPPLNGESLKEEALQSARLRGAAYRFCGKLARHFPDSAGAIEKVVRAAARVG